MSLFIGNLARGINERDLEDDFVNIGECTFRFKVTNKSLLTLNLNRATTPSLITRTISMRIRPSRNSMRRNSLAPASPCNSARRVTSTTPPRIEGPTAVETVVAIVDSTEAAALPEETATAVAPRPATIARSPVTSPESAVNADAPAADPTSKYNFNVRLKQNLVVVEAVVAAEVASEAVTSVTAEVAAISIVIVAPDTAAAEAAPTTEEMTEREALVVIESEAHRSLRFNRKLADVEHIKVRQTT